MDKIFHPIAMDRKELSDILARWGGEEFLVLLPETNMAGAAHIAERIRQQVSQLKWPKIPDGLTISIGLCEAKPAMELTTVTHLADQALYQAKASGRNRVVCHMNSKGTTHRVLMSYLTFEIELESIRIQPH